MLVNLNQYQPILKLFQIELRRWGNGKFCQRRISLMDGGNLNTSGFYHLNLFSRLKTRFCKCWMLIKLKIIRNCVYKEYEVKIKTGQAPKNEILLWVTLRKLLYDLIKKPLWSKGLHGGSFSWWGNSLFPSLICQWGKPWPVQILTDTSL